MAVRVKRIPEPIVSLAGKTEGYISKARLSACNGPVVLFPNCDYDLATKLITFTVTLYHQSASEVMFHRTFGNPTSAQFDEETKKMFDRLKRNDRIVISDIKIQAPDALSRQMADIKLTIFN